ncbi:MAG: RIP metalloprotease RseP [Candidatus Dactylopiibacterium sp.]|nr:RIP metalloprotease RseP [Candidatus Dactylopiibacterium sp.]
MSVIHYVLSFLVAIALLVAIHEAGHFLVARWCGVRVLRFSLGFGPQFFSCRFGRDRTEFSIAAIPLGGYVRMLDEREAPVDGAERHRAFNAQSLTRRSLIVLAGPVANLLLAILIYWGLALTGSRDFPARLGEVPAGSPAAVAGLREGDLIRSFDGRTVRGWSDLRWQVVREALDAPTVAVGVQRGGVELGSVPLSLTGITIDEKAPDPLRQMGLVLPPARIAPVLEAPLEGSAAQRAGLREGDRILRVDGRAVDIWADFVSVVAASVGRELLIEVDREGHVAEVRAVPEAVAGASPPRGRLGVAVKVDQEALQRDTILVRYGVAGGLLHAIGQTWSTSTFSLKVMWNIVTGKVSVRNISGPVTIADYAGQSASAGLAPYLKFLALVSISLGVLNLLPVPILDGGHLLYHAIEYVRGRPMSEAGEVFGQRLGMVFLALLMSLAFFNDINRILFG